MSVPAVEQGDGADSGENKRRLGGLGRGAGATMQASTVTLIASACTCSRVLGCMPGNAVPTKVPVVQ